MSRHRVKNVSVYDDDFVDDDDYHDDEDELTPEDREQMRLGSIEVRQLLQSEIPPVPATDEEIWEALWHYYYDVDKSVAYLRKKYRPPEQLKKEKRQQQKQTNELDSSYPLQPLPISSTCASPFSAREFFKDSPWLNVPTSRRAEILIEPLYPRLGLLGGASESSGKMSKLAALAAARKKKEAQANGIPSGASSQSVSPTPEDDRNRSISLLDRLTTHGKSQTPSPEPRTASRLSLRKNRSTPPVPASPRVPLSREMRQTAAEQSRDWSPSDVQPNLMLHPVSADMRAHPSAFATTIIGQREKRLAPRSCCLSRTIHSRIVFGQDFTDVFNFVEPSPDDIVLKAQSAAKGNKAKRAAAQQNTTKPSAELADSIKDLSVQEAPVKIKSKGLDVLAEYHKSKRKKAANFVVIGHVDAGKSTLMGRLLVDFKTVDHRTLEKYKREADKIGKGSFALAWVLDQGAEERARGVTIDFATNKFETEDTTFTILDAPGHRDFVPNMIAGASQADFAVLVIDASTGNFESGLKGQTKEHALLVRSMGVQRMVVAVNKMDTVEWSKDRFEEIEQQISSFLTAAGFQPKNLSFVPCSGLGGGNVTRRSEDDKAAWYKGRTLIEELDVSEPYSYAMDKPLRMTIGDVFRGGAQNPLSVAGRIDAGYLQVGEEILVMPMGEKATIKSLEVDQAPSDWAVAGQNVTLHLAYIDPAHIKTGDVICSPTSPIQNITSFTAKVLAFDHLTPMHLDVHRGRLHVPGRISKLVATLDKGSGTPIKKKPKIVAPGAVARIVVELEQPIPLEAPTRVVLRAGGETVAAGLLE
ncbi:hypothetical protein VTO42DRAFT_8324 [Malbranchea cinnamomea]